jgi:hypothetical protein
MSVTETATRILSDDAPRRRGPRRRSNRIQPEKVLYTVQEAGHVSGESPWTWRQRAYSGKVSSVKMGNGRLLIPKTEIDRLIEEGFRPAQKTA